MSLHFQCGVTLDYKKGVRSTRRRLYLARARLLPLRLSLVEMPKIFASRLSWYGCTLALNTSFTTVVFTGRVNEDLGYYVPAFLALVWNFFTPATGAGVFLFKEC